jgi:hypothetical protein
MRHACEKQFNESIYELQFGMRKVLHDEIDLIQVGLGALRDDNAVLESERDPEFRKRVTAKLEGARNGIEEAQQKMKEVDEKYKSFVA